MLSVLNVSRTREILGSKNLFGDQMLDTIIKSVLLDAHQKKVNFKTCIFLSFLFN